MMPDSKESPELVFKKLTTHGFSDKVVYEIWFWYHYDKANAKR
jgi:hypothetical protein